MKGLRKDFLTLLKNLPKVKDYETAHVLRDAFKVYHNRFNELFFEQFLNKNLKWYGEYSDHTRAWVNEKLRGPAWTFYIELSMPIGFADDYWSEEQRFLRFEKEYGTWKNRVQRKGQKFWRAMKDTLEMLQTNTGEEGFNVPTPDVDQTRLEGFQLVMKGYEGTDRHKESLAVLKAGLKRYRKNAGKRLSILLRKQLPMIVDFEATLDKGGEYNRDGTITIYTSSLSSKGPAWAAHMMAHEMGHHAFRTYLSGGARKFWTTAIKSDYGDLDIQKLLDNWPGTTWAFEFGKVLGHKDPVLALQVEAVSHDNAYGGRDGLQSKEDFQKLLDQGVKTLRVPKTPITGYANKNPEEAFCEAIGLFVTYGPRAVHKKIRHWLDIVLPGQVKVAAHIKGYKVMKLEGDRLVSGANSRLSFPARKGLTLRMPGKGLYLSPNKQYVLTYYSGLADDEALLTLSFDESDIVWGNLTDREAEVSVSKAKIVDIEALEE